MWGYLFNMAARAVYTDQAWAGSQHGRDSGRPMVLRVNTDSHTIIKYTCSLDV